MVKAEQLQDKTTQMSFNDMYTAENGVQYMGYRTPKYCTIFWLVDGVRKFKTVCYDSEAMAYSINTRTRLTNGLAFEIDYYDMEGNICVTSKTA